MRFTASLLNPRMWINMRGKAWYRFRKRAIPDDANFKRIIAAGYNVVDANEYVKPLSPLYTDYDSLPDLKPTYPVPPKNDRNNPDWHDEICKVFDANVFPIEGVQQALAFTKGVRMSSELPGPILERADSIKFSEEEDKMAQRIVQQAFLWDSYLEKLPIVKHPDYPSLNPRRVYGIPLKRSNEIVFKNFLRLIESKVSPSISLSRMMAPEEELRVNLERHNSRVQFRLTPIVNMVSTGLLKPILSKQEVEDTQHLPLTDIYPFLSTANMEEVNVYKEADHFAIQPQNKFPYIHTSAFSHHIPGSHIHLHPRWNDDRFMGATIMTNFATALLMAKRKYGPEVPKILPEPVTTQMVHMTGKEFQFCVLQLNTLDLEDSSPTSIKNNVWITEKIDLYSELQNYYGKEIFEGYNPEILKLVAGMYLST
ncbi:39S ribosomal protein L37, mitochondrial [Orchesella cincta]|uniref:Large ribosomal subunit protein mL37 n=1 Tax=Orchesella cincta TaxID=48709 RepID=A0A1D2NF31_ORCCI|nr:39S ribosomal protein L37, mitochondrial [Orchesella cincta]